MMDDDKKFTTISSAVKPYMSNVYVFPHTMQV